MADCNATIENPYAPGNCTFYCKQKVGNDLPGHWGDAKDWWPNAQTCGWRVGQAPTVGAIAIWDGGVDPPGGFGHCAYVTDVIDGGSWTVTEMNWQGLGRVDSRTINGKPDHFLGFIYPPQINAPTGGGLPGVGAIGDALSGLSGSIQAATGRAVSGGTIAAGVVLLLIGVLVVGWILTPPETKSAARGAVTAILAPK